jgi:hypothetical protein
MTFEKLLELLENRPEINVFAVVDLGGCGETLVRMEADDLASLVEGMKEDPPASEIPCNLMGEFLYVGVGA